MFRLRELTLARSRTAAAQAAAMASPLVFSSQLSRYYRGLELSLTCPQGDFADDLLEEEMREQASWTG